MACIKQKVAVAVPFVRGQFFFPFGRLKAKEGVLGKLSFMESPLPRETIPIGSAKVMEPSFAISGYGAIMGAAGTIKH